MGYFTDLGIDHSVIVNYLINNGYKNVKVREDRISVRYDFVKDEIKLTLDINLDDDTASIRHGMAWEKVKSFGTFNYQLDRWVLDVDTLEVLKILKRRLNKFNKLEDKFIYRFRK